MSENKKTMMDGCEAAADIAYRATSLAIIYPITPSSPMAESYEAWSSKGLANIWGEVPEVATMQSEAGAIAAAHGALQTGALATTFTASQGLLLMIPNMFKIAGELSPFAMHVSARSVARHALSIFGDHSDVMACRQTGFAMICSNSVQEAHDFALISHAATLETRVPFLHFFDGFRTSHEANMVQRIPDDAIRSMIPLDRIAEFRDRALVPERPSIRGTAQNPDVFFQAAEAANPFYGRVEQAAEEAFAKLASLTGRRYSCVEYTGPADAERAIVAMGSACETIEQCLGAMPGEKTGLVKIRLYRPFPAKAFADILPKSLKRIAVLDRTKESGSVGEPLYLDAIAALRENGRHDIEAIGGRYGLSSKEFTPPMAKAIFDELARPDPKREFTIGINDDVSNLSIAYDNGFSLPFSGTQCLFYGLGSDGTVGANKNSIKIITSEAGLCGQAYFEYDSKKSGGTTISHLRFSDGPIRAPYLVSDADFSAVHHFPLFFTLDMTANIKEGGTLLVNSPFAGGDLWDSLPLEAQEHIIAKNIRVFYLDAAAIARDSGMGRRINTIMQAAFFHLAGVIEPERAIAAIKKAIEKTYGKKGPEIVGMNFAAVDGAAAAIRELDIPSRATGKPRPRAVSQDAPEFVRNAAGAIIAGKGDSLPVSAMPADGTFPTATSQYEKRAIAEKVPVWTADKCVKCGKCVLACPHAAIRMKGGVVQASPLDCTGCTLCSGACPTKALEMTPLLSAREAESKKWNEFSALPDDSRDGLNPLAPKDAARLRPLFEFPGACAGCGEAGYIRLATQLFGERMVIANATGCSSIYGGNLPTTPYCVDSAGRGPAWSNSLFEDNAEYGYGQGLAISKARRRARQLLASSGLPGDLIQAGTSRPTHEVAAEIKKRASGELALIADFLVKKSIWIIGGDGWAYDIGYGGLDHVLNMEEDVNILVLDTEVYSNTGGQSSKSTPRGAFAKFATGGRALAKKDLGLIAMANANAYVAKVAMGANEAHTIRAFVEAESFDGPSIIIAYCPCIAHGVDLARAPQQAKRAVESGHWELYRFDPRRISSGEPPLVMDSKPASAELREYLLSENRFKAIAAADPQRFEEIIREREFETRYKRAFFEHMAEFRFGEAPSCADGK
ncbi:MAG: pyruvate:ferredoxin (flavodoxin) oxidoreductase [Rickettsiales bacterium]|jgi:pyruvate-ferredoxin/flavodoxin oxidoreductase|nr:pyruvate:ferredoxin (flavodoxin) oxidoreductase [Rickettsiales bacterium]